MYILIQKCSKCSTSYQVTLSYKRFTLKILVKNIYSLNLELIEDSPPRQIICCLTYTSVLLEHNSLSKPSSHIQTISETRPKLVMTVHKLVHVSFYPMKEPSPEADNNPHYTVWPILKGTKICIFYRILIKSLFFYKT